MGFEPHCAGRNGWIYSYLPPPCSFVSTAMHLTMMPSTQGHGELITDLSAVGPALCKTQVVGVAELAPTNQTRLLWHVSDVVAIPNPARLRCIDHKNHGGHAPL
jgi:hypothetical protein